MAGDISESQQRAWTLKSVLEILESISKILAAVAIPCAVAFGTWFIQTSQTKQSVSKDYVNMALGLLQSKPETDQQRELRDWAVDLLDDNAPTKLPAKTKTDLKSGALNLSNLFSDSKSPPTFGSAVSPDSKNLAIGDYGESINIYDLATGKLVDAEIPVIVVPSTPSARTTTTSKSRTFIADAFDEGKDAANAFIALRNQFVSALAYSLDGRKLLFGTSEGTVKLWNLNTGEVLNFEHEKAAVAAVAFMSGGNNILVRDLNGRIQAFDGTGKRLDEVKLRSGQ